MAMKEANPSALSTDSVLDAFNSDLSDEEFIISS